MADFHAGLDEIATGTQLSEGWTICVLSRAAAASFTAAADAEFPSFHFHAKEFMLREESKYRRLLELLKSNSEANAPSRLVFVLMDRTYRDSYVPFVHSVIDSALQTVGVTDSDLRKGLHKIGPGIGEMLRHISDLGSSTSIAITTDDDSDTGKLAQMRIATASGQLVSSRPFVSALYGAFRQKSHPNAPTLASEGIVAVPDETSRIVQAADVIGNFAMAYLFSKLTTVAKRRALKAKIFSDTFDESLDVTEAGTFGTVIGDDIQLASPGALVLRLVN